MKKTNVIPISSFFKILGLVMTLFYSKKGQMTGKGY